MTIPIVYYLAHPWVNDPTQSFKNAIRWTMELRAKGYLVFSPILHTHPYWKETLVYHQNYQEDWMKWDLGLLSNLKECIMLLSTTAIKGDVTMVHKKYRKNWHNSNEKVEYMELWHSQGCRQEWEYAYNHNIPVYSLEDFLKGEVVYI